ncbi:MAG TPA: phytanoyl-CoA dioxygenase family protein [Planctomycetota bacterium]|nr:phytanoyl-CoA dioxygenase family protein [Planctomycetota bacterium]
MTQTQRILTPDQVAEFEERGFVALRHAFSTVVAARIRAAIWRKLELDPDHPSRWTKALIHLRECFWGTPFAGAVTGRFTGAVDDLLGPGRWKTIEHMGWWPVAFPGFETPDDDDVVADWHVDGGHFHHRLLGPEQGLLPLFLFSDIGPEDGGTQLVDGSHLAIARALAAAEPAGLAMADLSRIARGLPRTRVTRVVGRAGDVILIHPFVVHARSPNLGTRVRFIANPQVSMRFPLRLRGSSLSPVERVIARAVAPSAVAVGAA